MEGVGIWIASRHPSPSIMEVKLESLNTCLLCVHFAEEVKRLGITQFNNIFFLD